jgi:hypothetical protein
MATGRFEARYSEGDNHNIGIMVGARYGGKNSAIYINNGFITGFAINIRNITANTTVAHEDCYLCCYNTSRITVTLPSPSSMSIGKVVYIRLVNAGGVNISGALHTSSGPVSSDTLTTAGGGGMYVNDGTRWMFNYLQI